MSLSGKRILITGGGRGIGRAIAIICVREGARVAICSRTKSELEDTASVAATGTATTGTATSNGKDTTDHVQNYPIEIFQVDVSNQDQVEAMVSSIVEKWGNIDILINNAGIGQQTKGHIHTLKSEDLEQIVKINVVSVHIVTSTVLNKCMKNATCTNNNSLQNDNDEIRGRIINVSSRAGKRGIKNLSFYVTSKFALEGYSATLAEELKDDKILVNTISPGKVNTMNFPKEAATSDVRSAESIRDGLLVLLNTLKTGHYLHVDELDLVRSKGLDCSLALKQINEQFFSLP